MALEPRTRIGGYEIVSLLGRGGMGEVYRARDLKLNRNVAIKVLPEDLAQDAERLARLRREAQVLAGLNHSNIAQIYGLDESDGGPALVLELVEGQTLADRIAAGRLTTADTLDVARQIADALEAAHERGVVHRDLKPANIKFAADGSIKVLDFGLAKAVSDNGSTVTMQATQEGTVLGTAAYMSPEQARGQAVDRRTDVWAFGCVLYEMLTGQRAFGGATVSDTMASVLTREPDWALLPNSTPMAITRLLHRCLEKDPRRRLRDLGDARLDIEDTLRNPEAPAPAAAPARVTRRTAIGVVAGATVGAAATAGIALRFPDRSTDDVLRFTVPLPDGYLVSSSFLSRVAISPDGLHLACNAVAPNQVRAERTAANRARMLIRSIRELEWKPLGEGVPVGSPFFSPDGQWVGIVGAVEGQRLRKHALAGGAPVTLMSFPNSQASGATWGTDDMIYFVSSLPGGLVQVSGQGGDPVEIRPIEVANGERTLATPHAIPGGAAVLFAAATNESESYDDARIVVFTPANRQSRVLVEGGCYPRYCPSGHVLYTRSGSLFAVPFDVKRLQVTGQPFRVLEGVMMSRNTGVANYDISASGNLVYVPGEADGGARTLYWVDRSGKAEKLPLPPRSYLHPRLSPDGRRLAIEIEGSSHDVHVYDFATGVLTNFTNDGVSHWPIWSPDGRRIGYRSGPMGRFKLFQMPADRSGAAQPVATPSISASAGSYGPDGRALAYTDITYGQPNKVMVTTLDGTAGPQPLDDTSFSQGSPRFSPNGRWLAYCTNESGRPEVYVKEFPNGGKVQISNAGGNDPVWRRDGRELFYRDGERMMAVGVSAGDRFDSGRPQELWRGPYSHGMSSSCGAPGLTSSNYDVSPDGQRFVMIQDEDVNVTSNGNMVMVVGFADDLATRRQGA